MRKWIKVGTRLGTLAALGGLLVMAPAPQTVSYGQSNCITHTFRKPAGAFEGEVLTLSCGGVTGAVSGSRIGVARAGGRIPSADYGVPGGAPAVSYATKLSPKKMRAFVQKQGVPWPRAGTKRARDMSTYGVYQITYKANGKSKTYKFGITKKGEARPRSQRARCRREMQVRRCQWQWVREDVPGWRTARKWEAHHAARYKARRGECPPGMRRCL